MVNRPRFPQRKAGRTHRLGGLAGAGGAGQRKKQAHISASVTRQTKMVAVLRLPFALAAPPLPVHSCCGRGRQRRRRGGEARRSSGLVSLAKPWQQVSTRRTQCPAKTGVHPQWPRSRPRTQHVRSPRSAWCATRSRQKQKELLLTPSCDVHASVRQPHDRRPVTWTCDLRPQRMANGCQSLFDK